MKKRKSKQDHYAALGVGKNAEPEEIKAAHRKAAKSSHPDKGGDPEKFLAIQRAFEVLSDPDKKARYDETGSDDAPNPDRAFEEACALLLKLVESSDFPESKDLIEEAKSAVRGEIARLSGMAEKERNRAKKLSKIAARFKRKNGGGNSIAKVFEYQASVMEENAKKYCFVVEEKKLVIATLDDYEFDFEKLSNNLHTTYKYKSPFFNLPNW